MADDKHGNRLCAKKSCVGVHLCDAGDIWPLRRRRGRRINWPYSKKAGQFAVNEAGFGFRKFNGFRSDFDCYSRNNRGWLFSLIV